MNIEGFEISARGGVRWVRLAHGRGNSLDPRTLSNLERAFSAENPLPTVLAGRGRSFCTGLDLDHALACDRDGMRELILGFHRAIVAVFAYPAPVVAALGGHALAGGALLSAACDVRVMAAGAGRWGIHGAHLGITYPAVAVEVVRTQYGRAAAEQILYAGPRHAAEEALKLGRVDQLSDPSSLEADAQELAGSMARGAAEAFAHTKLAARGAALRRLEMAAARGEETWLDHWFRPQTRRRIEAARAQEGPRP